MELKSYQVCPYSGNCPYNNTSLNYFCKGASSDRTTVFNCNFVDENGVFSEGKFRSNHDETGNMKIILE